LYLGSYSMTPFLAVCVCTCFFVRVYVVETQGRTIEEVIAAMRGS
jgi:hypothetical protein